MSVGTTWRPRTRAICSGREAIIGLSIKTKAQADAAPLALLDYVCIGGVFETMSKDNPDPPIGPAGFRELAAIIRGRAPAHARRRHCRDRSQQRGAG